MVWWWFIREDRKAAVAREKAQDQLLNDFALPDALSVDDAALRMAVLRIAQACVRDQLAVPEAARFSDESVKRPPNGWYIAIGRVDSVNSFGHPVTNWYAFACDPTLRPTTAEVLESDPRALPGTSPLHS
jgi:hypothetical protein